MIVLSFCTFQQQLKQLVCLKKKYTVRLLGFFFLLLLLFLSSALESNDNSFGK